MARKQEDRFACYTNHHLTSLRRPLTEHVNSPAPELPTETFEIIKLPVPWAVYEQTPNHYFPVCTWCDDVNRSFLAKDGTIKQGNYLTLTPVGLEHASIMLAMHLASKHRKKDVVPPFEPYGFILEQQPERVWKE